MNAAIGMYEDLLGQKAHVEVNQYLLEHDIGIVSNFYKIINEFDIKKEEYFEAETKHFQAKLNHEDYQKASKLYDEAIKTFNKNIESFFKIYGASLWDPAQRAPAILSEYESDLEQQACVYFIAYLYKKYSLVDGKIQRKEMDNNEYENSQGIIIQLTKLLEKQGFSAAFRLHAKVESIDTDEVPVILLEGAKLGNMDCRYALAERYLGFLAGSVAQDTPEEYKFLKGLDEKKLIEWIKESRDAGHVYGLSNMQLFMDNVIGALGALHEPKEDKVSEAQKLRLNHMAEIVQKISGDEKVNEDIDLIVNIQYDSNSTPEEKDEKYRGLREHAKQYVSKGYSEKFAKNTTHVDQTLQPIYDTFTFNVRDIAFQLEQLNSLIQQRLQSDEGIKSEIESDVNKASENQPLISEEDTKSMLKSNHSEIDTAIQNIRATLESPKLSQQSYHSACFQVALAVNKLRVQIYYQPHPKEWKESVNNLINNVLQYVRPREHKPYVLFLTDEQKVKREAIKIAKNGLKSLDSENTKEISDLLKTTKSQAVELVKKERLQFEQKKSESHPKPSEKK